MNKNAKKEMKELLALIFADGYENTGIKYNGAAVYVATYDKPVIANASFILHKGDDVWFANDNEYEKIDKLYRKI